MPTTSPGAAISARRIVSSPDPQPRSRQRSPWRRPARRTKSSDADARTRASTARRAAPERPPSITYELVSARGRMAGSRLYARAAPGTSVGIAQVGRSATKVATRYVTMWDMGERLLERDAPLGVL